MNGERMVRAFDVRVNSFHGSTVLVRRRDVYELGDVEELIWSLCDGDHSIDDIADAVAAQFDVEPATARADVQEFVEELRRDELVVPA